MFLRIVSEYRPMTQKLVGNIVGKGENDSFVALSPFLTMFLKTCFPRGVKSWDCVVKS